MNPYLTLAIILTGVYIFGSFITNLGSAGAPRISPKEAKKRLETEKGIILLDVRTREEYNRRHIPNSTLLPLAYLSAEAGQVLPDKDAEIFAYCASGSRSTAAVRTLRKLGYTRVYNLGGIADWPYETVAGEK